MKWPVLILLSVSLTVKAQDTAAYKMIITLQQKEIDRQDKLIMTLTDSVLSLNKKVFVLANINGNLKKKTNRQETWFKIGQGVLQGLILYFTSR